MAHEIVPQPEPEAQVSATDTVDHLLLGVANRELGIAWVEQRTGVKAVIGGSHPGVGTCNALLSLRGRQYLETLTFTSWNLISGWLARLDTLRRAA